MKNQFYMMRALKAALGGDIGSVHMPAQRLHGWRFAVHAKRAAKRADGSAL